VIEDLPEVVVAVAARSLVELLESMVPWTAADRTRSRALWLGLALLLLLSRLVAVLLVPNSSVFFSFSCSFFCFFLRSMRRLSSNSLSRSSSPDVVVVAVVVAAVAAVAEAAVAVAEAEAASAASCRSLPSSSSAKLLLPRALLPVLPVLPRGFSAEEEEDAVAVAVVAGAVCDGDDNAGASDSDFLFLFSGCSFSGCS